MTYNNLNREGGRKRKSLKKRGPKKSKLARKSKKAGYVRKTLNPYAGEDTNIRLAIRDCIRNINDRRNPSNSNISDEFYQIDKKLEVLNDLLGYIKCDNGYYLKDKVERISRGTRYTSYFGHNRGTESIKNAMKTLIATINSKTDAIYNDYTNNNTDYNNIKDFETDDMNNIMTNVCSNNNNDILKDEFHEQYSENNNNFSELPRDTGGIWINPYENNQKGGSKKIQKIKTCQKI